MDFGDTSIFGGRVHFVQKKCVDALHAPA